jgi:hypothetical protein
MVMRVAGHRLPFVLLGVACVAAMVPAAAQSVAGHTPTAPREIRACVFGMAGVPNPLLMVGLMKAAICPDGWTFSNPVAPPEMDGATMLNPRGLDDGIPLSPVGATATDYWAVPNGSSRRLVGMDFIYMGVNSALNLTTGQEDGVIRAVENGALLWIDGTTGASVTRFQPPRTTMTGGGVPVPFDFTDATSTVVSRLAVVPGHEIFNSLFAMDAREINQLGTGDLTVTWPVTNAVSDVSFQPLLQLTSATGAFQGYGALVTRYGAGAILVTSGSVGRNISAWVENHLSQPTTDQLPALKFAYNALAWNFSMRQQASAAGKVGGGAVRAPVSLQWQYPPANRQDPSGSTISFGPVVAAPVQFDGRLYVVSNRATGSGGDNRARLTCFDPIPEQDLDGDGNADDGITDFSNGASYDVIWDVQLPSGQSPKSAGVGFGILTDTTTSPYTQTPVVLCASTAAPTAASGAAGTIYAYNASTGAALWTFNVPAYGSSARVCDLSTPVVHNGWVYFVASEYDGSLPDPSGQNFDRCYGRAWCIDLATGGVLNSDPTQGGAQWVYPDPDLDRDGTIQNTTPLPANPTDAPENQRALPCFNDPVWVAQVGGGGGTPTELPPYTTPAPMLSSGRTVDTATAGGVLIDSMMIVSSPVTLAWDSTTSQIVTSDYVSVLDRGGGCDIALVPTPMSGDGSGALATRMNGAYWGMRLIGAASGWNAARRMGDPTSTQPSMSLPTDTTPSTLAHFAPVNTTNNGARQFIANWANTPANTDDKLALQRGTKIELRYTATGSWEQYVLPGPVIWKRQYARSEARLAQGAIIGDVVLAPTTVPVTWSAPASHATVDDSTVTGRLNALDVESGALKWRLDPRAVTPRQDDSAGSTTVQSHIFGGLGSDGQHYVLATSDWPTGGPATNGNWPEQSAVLGLRPMADMEIRLGTGPGSGSATEVTETHAATWDSTVTVPRTIYKDTANPGAVVTLLETGTTVPAADYRIDYDRRVLRFPANVATVDGLAGKAVRTQWADDTWTPSAPLTYPYDELHVLPPAHDFAYVPGFIKLDKYPVDFDSVQVYLLSEDPDETRHIAVAGVAVGEPEVALTMNGITYNHLLPNGWLDLRNAFVDRNGNGTKDAGEDWAVGIEVQVAYKGFYEPALRWTAPTSPASVWTTAVQNAYQPDTNGFIPIPNPALSLPAEHHQVPVQFGPSRSGPSVADRTVLLGTEGYPAWGSSFSTPGGGESSRDTLLAINWDPGRGGLWGSLVAPAETTSANVPVVTAPPSVSGGSVFVGSRLMSAPTVSAGAGFVSAMSTERTLICAGQRVIECVGSDPVRTLTGYVDTNGDVRSFAHVTRAKKLPNGNYLIVDTGANVVVEVDNQGNEVWSMGAGQAAQYLLDRPSDAWRYDTAGGDDWLDGQRYTRGAFVVHNRVTYRCTTSHTAGSSNEPGVGTGWTSVWKLVGAVVLKHTVVADPGYHRIVENVNIYTTDVWVSGTAYVFQDLVRNRNRVWRCRVNHTASSANEPGQASTTAGWATYWEDCTNEVYVVTPPAVEGSQAGQMVQVEYQTAQPIFDPVNGQLWGYLASAANWLQPIIVEPPRWGPAGTYHPARINPTGDVWGARIGDLTDTPVFSAGDRTWDAWTFLYNLNFTNIRQVEYVNYGGGQFGTGTTNNTYVWVVASSYTGLSGSPMGVYEFNFATGALSYHFTRTEYNAALGAITLPGGGTFTKAYFPTAAQRLPNGDYLIANYAGAVENLAQQNLSAAAWDRSLASEVFRATRSTNAVWLQDMIPNPQRSAWREPMSIVSYATRF